MKSSRKKEKIQKPKDPNLIEDLHGNTYRKGKGFHIRVLYPKFAKYLQSSYTKDIYTNTKFNLVKTEKNLYAIFQVPETKCYVQYRLTILSYNELHDIRKSYIRGNIYHS